MAVQVKWTHTASGFSESFTWLDDDDTYRIIQWAKQAYPNRDDATGEVTPATNVQASRRAAHSWINGMKDATRKMEKDAAVADVPEPPPISIVE